MTKNKYLKIGVSEAVLDAKTLIQSELIDLIKSLNLKLNESLIYDALNLSEDDKKILSKERFEIITKVIKNYKQEFNSTVKSSTKPFKDIFNSLKKEITDWESSINKSLNQASHNIHSVGILKGYEDLTVGMKSGANIEPVIEEIDLSAIKSELLNYLVANYARQIIKDEIKKGKGTPKLKGIKYKLIIPDANGKETQVELLNTNDMELN